MILFVGLFAYSHMDFETDRDKGEDGDPSLSEMTMKALSILNKNQKGYFLFVESTYSIIRNHNNVTVSSP